MISVKMSLIDGGRIPKQATEGSAGMDLYACIQRQSMVYSKGLDEKHYGLKLVGEDEETLAPDNYEIILPGEIKVISAGFKVEIPEGHEMQIRPRSGNSLKTNLRIANSPGTIDSDYRGEVGVIVDNIGDEPIIVFDGDRIAQAVIQEVPSVSLEQVDSLELKTNRGEGGFGSTGV
jgi:dUTP pyrophosphatase